MSGTKPPSKTARKTSVQKAAPKKAAAKKSQESFTKEERDAMRERTDEMKASARRSRKDSKADDEGAVLAKIAEMPKSDRALGERLHAIIKAHAPTLSPKLWYGMPAYTRNGKIVCFFQSAQKFKTRYATFGFMHEATLDDGTMWPTGFALTEITAAAEAQIAKLLKRAVR
jgi:uncharacterized protein YdhG (YjbR/CyaY superfamily)